MSGYDVYEYLYHYIEVQHPTGSGVSAVGWVNIAILWKCMKSKKASSLFKQLWEVNWMRDFDFKM